MFIRIKNKNNPVTILTNPPILIPKERKTWDEAVSLKTLTTLNHRGDITQYEELNNTIVTNEKTHINT